MSEKTYLRVMSALGWAKWEARRHWLNSWQMWPGASPVMHLTLKYAQELQDLNDAQAEVESLYFASRELKEA